MRLIVRPTAMTDLLFIQSRMRMEDRAEVWAVWNQTPGAALWTGYDSSVLCFTVLAGTEPIAVFGVNETDRGAKIGMAAVWMLGTDAIARHRVAFLRRSRWHLNMLLSAYPVLFNFVDARNVTAIRWLRWLGAEISDAAPYGVEQMPFHYFVFKRSSDHV